MNQNSLPEVVAAGFSLREKLEQNFYPFTALGENLIVNKNTGAVYKATDRAMSAFSGGSADESLLDELKILTEDGKKSIDFYSGFAKKLENEKAAPNSVCLIISRNCNFNCEYCYGGYGSAGYGAAGVEKADMNMSTALSTVDFLFSQNSPSIEFDFFGGEPLLNWDVCEKTIEYIKEKSINSGKKVKIALTTNGYLLDEEKIYFLNKHKVNLVLSLDGGRSCHNSLRKSVSGKDTFDKVYENLKQLLSSREGNYYLRGTYTGKTLNFYDSFKFYIDNGIEYFSLEPVVRMGSDLSIKKEDIEKIDKEYEKCARLLLEVNKNQEKFHFYHFNMNIYKPPCVEKKIRSCAAGVKYFAVDYNGDIYPCHQFVGVDKFKMGQIKARGLASTSLMGTVHRLITDRDSPHINLLCACPLRGEAPKNMLDEAISAQFKKNHIFNKEKCKNCWARVYCSGGCAASNYFHNKSIFEPEDINCDIMKIRTKYALAYNIKKGTRD